jgi:hypothetical protein
MLFAVAAVTAAGARMATALRANPMLDVTGGVSGSVRGSGAIGGSERRGG